MLIDRTGILGLIPHSGTMCLLDGVLAWDDESIQCLSNSHRDLTNPLRRGEHLAALHAAEYGAQATAIHGGLRARAAGQPVPPAYLAALRNIRLHVDFLHTIAAPLHIDARRLSGERGHCIYAFRIAAAAQPIAEGRVTVMTRPDAAP
jgi:predicted hotdog family 3-hydroxylacyl-ACP dehydratase